jgi:hypothetical protein
VALCHDIFIPRALSSPWAVNEFIEWSPFAVMRKRLIAWTILTSALLAVVVWTVLGPPDHPAGPNLHFRNLTAAVR